MSALIYIAVVAFSGYILACMTDSLISATYPLKNMRTAVKTLPIVRARSSKKAGKQRMTAHSKHQIELRELPFLC